MNGHYQTLQKPTPIIAHAIHKQHYEFHQKISRLGECQLFQLDVYDEFTNKKKTMKVSATINQVTRISHQPRSMFQET